ncbi:CYTH and CHAD domain-containing protein [Streptacidiphilus carbonis]|uniref:CYTH and CHAD domain-containing protein n=1 Tax=Streptacidiphilus carbonis TaxID=105422 RepID=UPI0005A7B214|nr:CYTH and CHAD domain-containing protein [Streptacidiphilus carbonis]
MTSSHIEKERKFDGMVDAALPALDGLPGVSEISDPDVENLDAVYYDTADLRLLEHGITLRRRTGGHDSGWHLKLPVGPDERHEVHLPLNAGAPGRVPRVLTQRTRAYARGQALIPIVHLRTQRRRRLLLDSEHRSLAEVAQDAVSAQVLAPERFAPEAAEQAQPAVPTQREGHSRHRGGGSSAVLTSWTEVEAELVEGGADLLDAVEQRFFRAGLRRSSSPSKLARALGRDTMGRGTMEAAPGRRARGKGQDGKGQDGKGQDGKGQDGKGQDKGMGRKQAARLGAGTVGAAVTALLRAQVQQLIALDPAVRADEADAVHQMRVAVRRLRSTLRTHRRLLAEEPGRALAEELRWLGAVLGEARDREVLGARLGAEIGRLPAAECPGPVRERIDSWASAEYRRSWKRAVATLDGPRYFTLLDGLEELAARPPLRGRARRGAVAEFRRIARREQRRVTARADAAAAAPAGSQRDQALHATRKAAKRARYAAEGARPAVGKPAKRMAKAMKRLQQLLGERQDALLACSALPELAAVAHRAGEEGFGYGVLYAGQRAAVAEVDRRFPACRRKAAKRRLSRFR